MKDWRSSSMKHSSKKIVITALEKVAQDIHFNGFEIGSKYIVEMVIDGKNTLMEIELTQEETE